MPELIDREETLQFIDQSIEFVDESSILVDGNSLKDRMTINGLLIARRIVSKQHTIEPEVRRGRWKKKNGEIYCTNCKKSKWSESFELMLRGFDFCPKCGADMREGGADNA